MLKRVILYCFLFALGFGLTFALIRFGYAGTSKSAEIIKSSVESIGLKEHTVIGFLPYWLITKADKDYSSYINNETYFGLTVNPDGSLQKFTNPGESEPGWHTLNSGKFTPSTNMKTTLLVFNSSSDDIDALVSDPITHANTLVSEVAPIMAQYGFTGLNIDIEKFVPATESARQNFTTFVCQIKKGLNKPIAIDASPTDLIKTRLINLPEVEPCVDSIVLMAYDYHYTGSLVTGPVAPLGGAGTYSEFDTETGVQKALEVLPADKIILGIPLYGYQWETITDNPRAAVIPGSGVVASSRTVEDLLAQCATCSAGIETEAKESYLIYKDQETGTYIQYFYPDTKATQAKIDLANKYHLGGIAFWALGYDGETILSPVKAYKDGLK